jgi:hypothetical protein
MVGTDLGVVWFRRDLNDNDLAGTMPTQLGLLTAVTGLYVQRETPSPSCSMVDVTGC